MGPIKTVAAIACGAMLLTSAAATAQTTEDRTTFVTFSGPVSIPGKTLPAGTYTFRLADSPADRHIVQVFDKDQSKLFATILAVPADRVEAEGDPVVTFKETRADLPPAVRYWYYAGERSGNEFVYPKTQALTIAQASGESVMSVDSDSSNVEDWKNGKTARVTANTDQASAAASPGQTTTGQTPAATATPDATAQTPTATAQTSTPTAQPTTTAPASAQAGSPESATVQPSTTPASTRPVATSGRSQASELPRTASELPAIGLLGVFALAGALVLHVARRATA